MRKHMVLTVLALMFSLITGFQLVATQVRANSLTADVDIDPDSLLLKDEERGYGKWITAYIGLPDGYDVNNISVSSVTLEVIGGHVSVSRYDVQGNILMVKFDRAIVISFLWPMIEHMSPRVKHEVTLTVTGNLCDGDAFEGSDSIKVFYTHL